MLRSKTNKVRGILAGGISLCVGVLFALLVLEIGIRAVGALFLIAQERGNVEAARKAGQYRIMCLGESTTARQYPKPLETILNLQRTGLRFSVIDRGVVGTNTFTILQRLEQDLDKYKPDMVVLMAGCNDRAVLYYKDIPEASAGIFRHWHTYRLARLIEANIAGKIKPHNIAGISAEPSSKGSAVVGALASSMAPARNDETTLRSKSFNAYLSSALTYRNRGQLALAEAPFLQAIEIDPSRSDTYRSLAELYRLEGRYALAEAVYRRAIEVNRKDYEAYVGLGHVFQEQRKSLSAELMQKKAIVVDPLRENAYVELGNLDFVWKKYVKAEKVYRMAIRANAASRGVYFGLGELCQILGRAAEAEKYFQQSIAMNPDDPRAYRAIVALYEKSGQTELSREYVRKAEGHHAWQGYRVAVENFRRIKQILDRRHIGLVCVQYPMRPVEPLKEIFANDRDVVFVDNEAVFKKAVRRRGFGALFVDMFGGDFGHCTQMGNELLAGNIARVILKEHFGKEPRWRLEQ
jgi:tetratricopeptide (TPR) repeat protein